MLRRPCENKLRKNSALSGKEELKIGTLHATDKLWSINLGVDITQDKKYYWGGIILRDPQ